VASRRSVGAAGTQRGGVAKASRGCHDGNAAESAMLAVTVAPARSGRLVEVK
jgi:hypothetical protein